MLPTRMNLAIVKSKVKAAQTGHSLLKKKADALTKRFRAILAKITQVGYPPQPRSISISFASGEI